MWRSLLSLALCLPLFACAGKESPGEGAERVAASATPDELAPEVDAAPAKRGEPGRCEGLLSPDDVAIRHIGQGSHGAATTDVTIDLAAGTMKGSDYKLDADGDTPIALTVDQVVDAKALAALRERMQGICAPRRVAQGDEHSAPGGSTLLEIKHADDSSLFVTLGAANLPAGATVAEPSREEWTALFELWPRSAGKE